MAFARLHETAEDHPKVVSLSDGAFRLWTSGLSYCQRHLTDGYIPSAALRGLQRFSPRRLRELVDSGLWERQARDVVVHDYLEWNDSRETILEKRAKAKQRYQKHTDKRVANAVTARESATSPSTSPSSVGAEGERLESGGRAPLVTSHRGHACCGRVCLPAALFDEFRRKYGGNPDESDGKVRAWFGQIDAEWSERSDPIGEDSFAFWRARWAESFPATVQKMSAKSSANRTAIDRFVARGEAL